MQKAALLYYCRSGEGPGHLRRAFSVARALGEDYAVTLLVSDDLPAGLVVPDGARIERLPDLGIDPENKVVDVTESDDLKMRIVARRDRILDLYGRLKPRVVIVEKFPLGQQILRGELLPLVERARLGVHGPSLVACVTDGIVTAERPDPDRYNDTAANLLNKYFDLVVVHSDPVFARLEEFFRPKNHVTTPLYHTGFVVPDPDGLRSARRGDGDGMLVTAGDGYCGGGLYRAAVDAQRHLWETLGVPMTIIGGRRLPEQEWELLAEAADDVPGLALQRETPDLRSAIANARWVISHCGYNTAINTFGTRTPTLYVPCPDGHRLEQISRAQRLVYWGAGRMLMPHHVNTASMMNELQQLMRFEPREVSFDFNGAVNTARLINHVVREDTYAPNLSRPTDSRWLH